jgi:hypothetical protein
VYRGAVLPGGMRVLSLDAAPYWSGLHGEV